MSSNADALVPADNKLLKERFGPKRTTPSVDIVNSWHFNALVMKEDESFSFLEYLFRNSSESQLFSRIPWVVMSALLHEVRRGYRSNPYHRWEHAVDVTHTVYRYLTLSEAHAFLLPTDRMGLLLGAIMHDIGHNGVNNQFLIDSEHELAGLFNDRSPLENFHCFKFFSLLKLEGCNIFQTLTREEVKQIRAVIIESVIHTDNMYHFGIVKDLEVLIATGATKSKEDLIVALQTARVLMNNFFLHSADISNPTKPTAICKEWAYLVMQEFFAQGDQEELLGLPVQPLNDRNKVNIPLSQLGFVEFFVVPLELCKLKLFPTAFVDNAIYIVQNMLFWSKESGKDKEHTRCRKTLALFEQVLGHLAVDLT